MNQIAHLIAGPWLMNERTATMLYAQYITGRLSIENHPVKQLQRNGGVPADSVHAFLPVMGMIAPFIGTYSSAYKIKHPSGKNVAIMPVIGSLTKRGELCSYGMEDYINEIDALNANEDICAIVMKMEGPGGTVDGTPEFGLTVYNSAKPIVVFGDCMVASADYWVASQAKFIIGNKNNPTEFGSIGVLCVHEFWGKYIDENIGSIRIIRAPQSIDKALINPFEELTSVLEKEMKTDLSGLAVQFFDTVKSGRGASLKESEAVWGTGKMYKNTDAIALGLIDAEGTIMDAVNKAVELSQPGTIPPADKKENASARGVAPKQIQNKKQMNTKEVARKVSSFFKPKKATAQAAAAEPAAAEDTTPVWTPDLVFNTDGSGDGAFCLEPDTDGNDRKFETKIDNNQGNEPPTDPSIAEDDNWSLVADASAPAADGADAGEITTVAKMNVALKNANAQIKKLQAELTTMKGEQKANDKKPAGPATTVVTKGDTQKRTNLASWEQNALKHLGKLKDN